MEHRLPTWIGSDVHISLQLRTGVDIPGVLLQIGSGQVHIRTSKETWPGSAVVVKFDHLSFNGEVSYCKAKGKEYLTCVEIAPEAAPQRREPRFPMNLPAKVIVIRDSSTMVFPGIITDLSRSGLGLLLAGEALDVANIVYVETEKMLIVGEVRYCRKSENGQVRAGLEATDVFSDPTGDPFPATAINKVNRLVNKLIK